MELNITKERVIEAANSCPTAKTVLKILFPEAFEPEASTYKSLGFKPGTKWRHTGSRVDNTYIYVSDTAEIGRRFGFSSYLDSFFSISNHGMFVHTSKRATDLVVVSQ